MKFRRKVIEIDAEQYQGEIVKGICTEPTCFINLDSNGLSHHVHTIHRNQPVQVEKGDYIIPEPNGVNYYPCKPEIFKATYEAV